eukprot:2528917-Amphidinium_carterae.1
MYVRLVGRYQGVCGNGPLLSSGGALSRYAWQWPSCCVCVRGALSECAWQWPSCGLSVRWGAISMQVAMAIHSVAPKNLEASLY